VSRADGSSVVGDGRDSGAEQMDGSSHAQITDKVDVFGFGMCLLHSLLGDVPDDWPLISSQEVANNPQACSAALAKACLDGDNKLRLVEHMSSDDPVHARLFELLSKCLAVDPVERPSIGTCVDDLLVCYSDVCQEPYPRPEPLVKKLWSSAVLRRKVLIKQRVERNEREAALLQIEYENAKATETSWRMTETASKAASAAADFEMAEALCEAFFHQQMPPPPPRPPTQSHPRYHGSLKRSRSSRPAPSSIQ